MWDTENRLTNMTANTSVPSGAKYKQQLLDFIRKEQDHANPGSPGTFEPVPPQNFIRIGHLRDSKKILVKAYEQHANLEESDPVIRCIHHCYRRCAFLLLDYGHAREVDFATRATCNSEGGGVIIGHNRNKCNGNATTSSQQDKSVYTIVFRQRRRRTRVGKSRRSLVGPKKGSVDSLRVRINDKDTHL